MSENGKLKQTPEEAFNMRLAAERELLNGAAFGVPVVMGLAPIVSICGLLQLAMRHPGTKGQPSAKIAHEFIAGMIVSLEDAGFKEHAQLVRMGDNPRHDQPAAAPPVTMPATTGPVFRVCKSCGSAEDVDAGATTCPGCGAAYAQA